VIHFPRVPEPPQLRQRPSPLHVVQVSMCSTTFRSCRGAVTGHTQCDTRYSRLHGGVVLLAFPPLDCAEAYLRPAPPQGLQLPLPPQVGHFDVTHEPFLPLPLHTRHSPLPLHAAHGFFATVSPSRPTG